MGAIGEAKERIAAISDLIDTARSGLTDAQNDVRSAFEDVRIAAGDTGHPKVDEALTAFAKVSERLNDVGALAAVGQAAGNEYAEGLG